MIWFEEEIKPTLASSLVSVYSFGIPSLRLPRDEIENQLFMFHYSLNETNFIFFQKQNDVEINNKHAITFAEGEREKIPVSKKKKIEEKWTKIYFYLHIA